jgi:glycosyltransferase involved in cell wall biosynthesis
VEQKTTDKSNMRVRTAIVSVTNDLVTDRRVNNTCMTLQEAGFHVLLVGRRQVSSRNLEPRTYQTHRMRLLFERGFFFYAEYNIRLFFYLLFRQTSILVANDLDTLLPNYLVSRLRRKPLLYDTHEFFTGVPELAARRGVRKIWECIEKRFFPSLKHITTVNDSIAKLYKDLYGKEITVVRNVPPRRAYKKEKTKAELNLPEDKAVILFQGAWINADRGGEEIVEAMQYMDDAILLIIGGGDVIEKLMKKAEQPDLKGKVFFIPRLPFSELYQYSVHADIGLTLDKDTNINYRFSLPNKLFDYIQAGVPVLASPLPEITHIVEKYKVGEMVNSHDPLHIASKIQDMLADRGRLTMYRENCLRAAQELCWENEKARLLGAIERMCGK